MASNVYILASERSGTNLLRSLISNHSVYEGPIPIHFFDTFLPALTHYGDLRRHGNCISLIEHALRLANHGYHDWSFKLSAQDLYDKYRPSTAFDVFSALYQENAVLSGKQKFVCKDNNLFNYAFYILANEPNAKFIYLHRDVRDYCASWKGVPAMQKTSYDLARVWVGEQQACMRLMDAHGVNALKISYENLVENTQAVMSEVMTFLGVEIEPACFTNDPQKNKSAAERNEFWKNISKPVFAREKNSYLNKLKVEEVTVIESVAAETMQRLEYEKDFPHLNWRKSRWFKFKQKIEKSRLARTAFNGDALLQDKLKYVKEIQKRLVK